VLIVLVGSGDPGFSSGPFIGESTYWRTAYALDIWRRGHFSGCSPLRRSSFFPVTCCFLPGLSAFGEFLARDYTSLQVG
jgi:hypothetical protein